MDDLCVSCMEAGCRGECMQHEDDTVWSTFVDRDPVMTLHSFLRDCHTHKNALTSQQQADMYIYSAPTKPNERLPNTDGLYRCDSAEVKLLVSRMLVLDIASVERLRCADDFFAVLVHILDEGYTGAKGAPAVLTAQRCCGCRRPVSNRCFVRMCSDGSCGCCIPCGTKSCLDHVAKGSAPKCPAGHDVEPKVANSRLGTSIPDTLPPTFVCPGDHPHQRLERPFPLEGTSRIYCEYCSRDRCSDCGKTYHQATRCFEVAFAQSIWPSVWAAMKYGDVSRLTAIKATVDAWNAKPPLVHCPRCLRLCERPTGGTTSRCRCGGPVSSAAAQERMPWGHIDIACLDGVKQNAAALARNPLPQTWVGVKCSLCGTQPVEGIVIHCLHCNDFHACFACCSAATDASLGHKSDHALVMHWDKWQSGFVRRGAAESPPRTTIAGAPVAHPQAQPPQEQPEQMQPPQNQPNQPNGTESAAGDRQGQHDQEGAPQQRQSPPSQAAPPPQAAGRECIICMDGTADYVYIPCGHGGLCATCSRVEAYQTKCAVCISEPVTLYRVYL